MTTVYLGLGSNLGNREENLWRAIALLALEIEVKKKSSVYETVPMYVREQPKFLNMVVEADTKLSANDIFKKTQQVQNETGKHVQNQPRIIDIDILFYGDQVIETPDLKIPHPKVAERPFVLVPLSEIAPNFVHPGLGVTMLQLLEKLGDTSKEVRKTDSTI